MSGSIFKQGDFEIEKMINNKDYSPRTLSRKPDKTIILDNKKGYHVFDELENLDGYTVVLKDLFNINIKNCDLGKEDKININTGITAVTVQNCTISNSLNINNIDLEDLVIKDSYIDKLVFYNCKNINEIHMYNTTINELVFNCCNIYQGILMNDGCVINNLDIFHSFIINYRKHYYNNIYSKYIRNSYDYIIDDRLIDVVKDKVSLNNSCIIEQEGDEAFNYYYNKKNNEDIEPINEN